VGDARLRRGNVSALARLRAPGRCLLDGVRSRLYSYSDEMGDRYAAHRPIQELAVHLGMHETELPARDGDDLLWMGRIDADKAPHLAIRAAHLLGRRITVAGPVFDSGYLDTHRALFNADHVTVASDVGGEAKMRLLAEADALVYTCARGHIEAGAATFGESLRAGTPGAAIAWRPGTCAHAALCDNTGSIAVADPGADDETAAIALAEAIGQVTPLRAPDVQEIGLARFDPAATSRRCPHARADWAVP
jgi:glycosyltransferase involved in cell wall biosynthesis